MAAMVIEPRTRKFRLFKNGADPLLDKPTIPPLCGIYAAVHRPFGAINLSLALQGGASLIQLYAKASSSRLYLDPLSASTKQRVKDRSHFWKRRLSQGNKTRLQTVSPGRR
jgi:hypothetical protein